MRPPVHVVDIEAVVCDTGHGRDFVFVFVHTDAGVSGVGEASQSDQDAAVVTNVRQLGATYLRANVFELIERGTRLYGSDRAGRAMIVAASGIELALWDVIGKLLEVPVYQLLGGSAHDAVACYATLAAGIADRSPASLADAASEAVARGFRGVKVVPFVGVPRDVGSPDSFRPALEEGAARVAAVRRAVGDDVAILVECAWQLDVATAVEAARLLEPHRCFWLEAPLRWDDAAELARLRTMIPMRLASGEALHGRRAYEPLFRARAVDIVQPDVKWTGGLLEARRIAAWAEACQMGVAPHNNSGPVATAASAHLAINTPNVVALEMASVDAAWHSLVPGKVVQRDGVVDRSALSQGVGFGIDVEALVAAIDPWLRR